MAPTNLSVVLVQQGVWSMDVESMPLAAGYLKAFVEADPEISRRTSVRLLNLNRQASPQSIVRALTKPHVPDIIGFSVLGWNYHVFGKTATTIKQISPDTTVVFGGNHVTGQAKRTFAQYPAVDIIVNGEGELTFREMVRHGLAGTLQESRASIAGISYQDAGAVRTTAARPRLTDLSVLPSPFLTGAIPLEDAHGNFRYDVALMETNRGCPYKCAFCYWGGAVAQRVRAYPRERLRAEIELFAEHDVETVALCDANFGMFPSDVQFVRDLLDVRDSHGYPVALECSWAKNKSTTFRSIVEEMSRRRLKSSFTIALQSLDEKTLDLMNRRNMRINDWQQLADWLEDLGFACYAELIWGAPGETVESFLAGYDKLTERIGRVATYPLLLIPNTHYFDQRDTYGFVTVQGDQDDFEYVVANRGISLDDTWSMSRFMFWSRLMSEHAIIRNVWRPALLLAGLKQSDIIRSVADWVAEGGTARDSFDELAVQFGSTQSLSEALTLFHTGGRGKELLGAWWEQRMRALLPEDHRDLLAEVFRFDLETLPELELADDASAAEEDEAGVARETWSRTVLFDYDVLGVIARLREVDTPESGSPFPREPTLYELSFRAGLGKYINNHEEAIHYFGKARRLTSTSRGGGS